MAAVVACGLDAAGISVDVGNGDAGPDGSIGPVPPRDGTAADATEEGSDIPIDLDATPIFDASLDTNPENCAAVCDKGSCDDAGTCVITCDGGAGSCAQNVPVVCPPGVPCQVDCTGSSSCNRGVDCTQASRCTIDCSGPNSCQGGAVACTGDSCRVVCSGQTSCNQGVSCDAGNCILRCTADNACQGNPVTCASDTCIVQCGSSGGGGETTCNQGVSCRASTDCRVACLADNACQGRVITAQAPVATVTCSGQTTCSLGVSVTSLDGSVVCTDDSLCGNRIWCDGGRCNAACSNTSSSPIRFCCAPGTACTSNTSNGCDLTKNNCP